MSGIRVPTGSDYENRKKASQTVGAIVTQQVSNAFHFFRHPIRSLSDLGTHLWDSFRDGVLAPTEEELHSIKTEIAAMGGDSSAVNIPAVTEERRREALQSVGAFSVGLAAGGVTGALTRTALARIPAAMLEGAVFGATEQGLAPLPEDQSRLEAMAVGAGSVALIGAGLGAAGAGARMALRSRATRTGIKPELETPEVAPMTEAYDPFVDARAPRIVRPDPFREPIMDPSRLLPLRRTDPRGPTIGNLEALEVEAANRVRAGIRNMMERPVLNDVSAQEITTAMKEPIGGTKHTALELVKAEDNLGFDRPGQGVSAIIRHEDWATRWPPPEGSDISARRYKLLGEWRDATIPRIEQAMEDVRAELRTEGGGSAGLPIRGGMAVEKGGARGGGPPRSRPPARQEGVGEPEPGGGGPPMDYNKAVDLANSKISVNESVRNGRRSWDWYMTEFIDELHPLNVVTRELLTLRSEAAKQLQDAGTPYEVLGVSEGTGRALTVRGRHLRGQPAGMLPPGGGPLVIRNAAGRALVPFSEAVTGRQSMRPGFRLPGLQDPYLLARISRGSIDQAIEMLENGTRDFTTLQRNGPGFREVAIATAREGLEQELRAFLLAPRSLDFAARGMTPPIPVEAARSIIKNAPQRVVDLAEQYFQFRDRILDYVKESGAISDAALAAVRKASERFVSFERFFEATNDPVYPGFEGKRQAPQFQFKAAEGGGVAPIINPMETIISNTVHMITMANRHASLEALVRLAEGTPGQSIVRRVGEVVRPRDPVFVDKLAAEFKDAGIDIPANVVEEIALRMRPSLAGGGRFFVFRDGKKVMYEVDPHLYDAIVAMRSPQVPALVRSLSAFTSIFRAGTILDPAFGLIRNPFRDQFSTGIYSRAGFKPLYDPALGVFSVLKKDDLYHQFRADLGAHSSIVRSLGRDRRGAQAAYEHIQTETSALSELGAMAKNPKLWLELLRTMTEKFEAASRLRENARVLAETGDPRIAGFAAREGSLDFQKMGASVHLANNLSPFLAAGIQGVEKVARAFKEEPVGTSARVAAYITAPTIALWLINFDDPEYQNLPWSVKDNYWHIPRFNVDIEDVNGVPIPKLRREGFFRLPKPFELGLIFGASVERVLQWIAEHSDDFREWMMRKDVPPNHPFEDYLSGMIEQLVPGNVPPWASVFLETQSGYDFFMDREIVPESEQGLLEWLQAGPNQGETVRLLGRVMNVSPRIIDNMIADATGGLGRATIQTVDRALGLMGAQGPAGERPTRNLVPLLGPMLSTVLQNEPHANSKAVQRFYDTFVEIGKIVKSATNLERSERWDELDVLIENNHPEMLIWDHFVATNRQMGELREEIRALYRDRQMPSDVRHEELTFLGRWYRSLAAQQVIEYNLLKDSIEQDSGAIQDVAIPGAPKRVPR
jgi:hypothetical protein